MQYCNTFCALLLLFLASLASHGEAQCLRRPCAPTVYRYAGRAFTDSEMASFESEEAQGLAQSSTHWYWTSRRQIQRVPRSGDSTANMFALDMYRYMPAAFASYGYDHFGDPDFCGNRLYVPITGPGRKPAVLVYTPELLLLGWGTFNMGGNSGWVAINPNDGNLYTSQPFRKLHVYSVARLMPGVNPRAEDASAGLGYVGSTDLTFVNPRSAASSWWSDAWIQGGAFSPKGVLYYVLDLESADKRPSDYTGVHVFEPVAFGSRAPIRSVESMGPPATEIFVPGSGNLGYMDVPIDGQTFGKRHEELEGVTVYRGADGGTHVLLVKLINQWYGDDDVTLYHFVATEP